MNGEFYTIKELAKELSIEVNAVKVRLHRLKIESVTSEALYDKAALEALRKVPGKGAPKGKRKPKEETDK